MEIQDPEIEYGEMAVRCVLGDGHPRVLPWPAYAAAAERLARKGRVEIIENMGRKLFRLIDKKEGF